MHGLWMTVAPVFEEILVTAIVAASVVYSAWRMTSARVHLRVLDAVGHLLGNSSVSWLGSLRSSVLAKLSGGGCGACSSNVKLRQGLPGSARAGPESKT
jgi:hypothetical protein